MIAATLRRLERLLLPNACVACDALVEPGRPDALVCSVCRARMQPLTGGCERCAQPRPPVGPCRFCASWPPQLRWVRSAVWLGEESRRALHRLKYGGYWALASELAEILARTVHPDRVDPLVPVPLAPRRLRERGYNQAALLARALGERWRVPVWDGIVIRTRNTTTQTALDPAARVANVRGAFRVVGGPRQDAATARSRGDRVAILVDDVLTTGATLAAAATALAGAGFDHIGAVTFARALPFTRRAEVN